MNGSDKLFAESKEEAHHSEKGRKSIFKYLEEAFDTYLGEKAPNIPEVFRDMLVIMIPWIVVFFIVLTAPIGLAVILNAGSLISALGLQEGLSNLASLHLDYLVSKIFVMAASILSLIAIFGLMNRTKSSWHLLYYSTLLIVISNLAYLSLTSFAANIAWLYILFQIKEHYRN